MNLLYLLVLFLPFQFALNLMPDFDVSVLRLIILVFFTGIIIKSLYKRDFFIPFNLQSVCLAGFFLINILSLFFAQNLEFGLRKILFLASIFPLYFVVQNQLTTNNSQLTTKFIKSFIVSGLLASVVALTIFFSQFIVGIDGVLDFYRKIGPFFWGRSFSQSVLEYQSFLVNVGGIDFVRTAGLFPDPHNFALFAGIILFLSGSLFLYFFNESSRRKAFFYGLVSLAGVFAVFLSFSRGAYLALIMAMLSLVVIVFYCHSGSASWRRRVSTALIIFLFLVFSFLVFSPAKNRFLDIFSLEDGSNIGRIQIMKDGLDIFKNNFLFGVGTGNAPLYYNEDIDYRNPTNSHNTYLEIAIEGGFVGLTVWIVLIFGTILQLVKHLKFQKDEFFWYTTNGLIGALAFFSVHSFFEVFLYSPINLAALMILLALSSKIVVLSPKI